MRENTLKAIRIHLEGPVASFRYPHFLIGRQPSFPMPPPSTVYGLISTALGYYPDPKHLRFAYRFSCEKERTDDVETIWFVEKETSIRGKGKEKNLLAQSNVLSREWLLHPCLSLYLTTEVELQALYEAFRCPAYILSLGRSQELVSVRDVQQVHLSPCKEGRLSPGLFPRSF